MNATPLEAKSFEEAYKETPSVPEKILPESVANGKTAP
jgi:hypothetical protein